MPPKLGAARLPKATGRAVPEAGGFGERWGVLVASAALLASCGGASAAAGVAEDSQRVLGTGPRPAKASVGTSATQILYNGEPVYLSGFNVAWFDFARDLGRGLDERALRQALSDLTGAGGNTLRWWIHTDGSLSPRWERVDGQARVAGPGGTFMTDFAAALDIASEYGAFIVPSLWSFDMLRDNEFRQPPTGDNYRLLTDDDTLQSYIDNVLEPMVERFNSHSALIAWELFNEPENMTEPWFSQEQAFYGGGVPTLAQLQRVQGRLSAAIHRAAQSHGGVALVTTGSKSMGKYNSDVAGGTNLYRDDRLIEAAGGDKLAPFDFYEPHYYNNEGRQGVWSPFHRPASYWQVDKPIVVGEFHSNETLDVLQEPVEGRDLCGRLANNGYAGGWPWQWNEHAAQIIACLEGVARRE